MIRPMKDRVLVRMVPAVEGYENPHGLTLVDGKKHYDHRSRKGVVVAVAGRVRGVRAGETVLFRGDAGFTMDGDPEVQDRPELGEDYRWLRESECLAVVEPEPEPQVAIGGTA